MKRERTIAEVIVDQQEEINDLEGKLYRLANEMEYEGNSVAYIYSKAKNYGDRVHEYRLRAEEAERQSEKLQDRIRRTDKILKNEQISEKLRVGLSIIALNDYAAAPGVVEEPR